MNNPSSNILLAALRTQLPRFQAIVGNALTLTLSPPSEDYASLADWILIEDWTLHQRLEGCGSVIRALASLFNEGFHMLQVDAATTYLNAAGDVRLDASSLRCLPLPSSPLAAILTRQGTVLESEGSTVYKLAVFAASCLTEDGSVAIDDFGMILASNTWRSGLASEFVDLLCACTADADLRPSLAVMQGAWQEAQSTVLQMAVDDPSYV
eukprot:TRINITY_DN7106_c0_g1_i4.p1 TRINITY_DN7106_c0_g1~~TRINITY_DN7106_c0_g1_i4.p1  ORF type:complete len:210 (+),score=38.27 TRINITY_DN7106_c0_g1_i4:36-665(+)